MKAGGEAPAPRVLIVDDETDTSEEIIEFLERKGIEGIAADRAGTALAIIEGDPTIGVVVTDLRMPDMSGIELLQRMRVRTNTTAGRIPLCIVLTGHATPQHLAAANEAGAFRVLRKPCSLHDLHAEIEAALASAHAAGRDGQGLPPAAPGDRTLLN